MLYPLKFKPIVKKKIWGEEVWMLSAYGEDISEVTNGYLAGNDLNDLVEVYMSELVGEQVYEQYGNLFPLLIKTIDAHDKLSIQVHPDDEQAAELDSLGKDEMWYVLKAQPESRLLLGFNQDMSYEQVQQAIADGTLPDYINHVPVKVGDVVSIPAGTIHSLGSGIKVIEVQETSDLTFRVYDYNRLGADGQPRELHLQEALTVMDYKAYKQPQVACFTTNIISLNTNVLRDYAPLDSFVILTAVEGSLTVTANGVQEQISTGETILIPAALEDVQLQPLTTNAKVLETYIDE